MPLEGGTIVGLEGRKSDVGKLRPQQRNQIESRHAPAPSEKLAHQAFCPVPANRTPYPTRCDNPQPASVEAVRKREQSQVAAADAGAPPLHTEKLPAPSNPVAPGQGPIHVPGRLDRPRKAAAIDGALDGKALAALRATSSQDFPPHLRAHPLAKPVRSLSPPVVGLIRALHALRRPLEPASTGQTWIPNRHDSERVADVSTSRGTRGARQES